MGRAMSCNCVLAFLDPCVIKSSVKWMSASSASMDVIDSTKLFWSRCVLPSIMAVSCWNCNATAGEALPGEATELPGEATALVAGCGVPELRQFLWGDWALRLAKLFRPTFLMGLEHPLCLRTFVLPTLPIICPHCWAALYYKLYRWSMNLIILSHHQSLPTHAVGAV